MRGASFLGQVHLIDWELSGFNIPELDFALLLMEWAGILSFLLQYNTIVIHKLNSRN
jgi:thiamine kinase-like enzyme